MTKLYILKRLEDEPRYDVNNAVVVRAQSPEQARQYAAEFASDEKADTWLNEARSSCLVLEPDGELGVIAVEGRDG